MEQVVERLPESAPAERIEERDRERGEGDEGEPPRGANGRRRTGAIRPSRSPPRQQVVHQVDRDQDEAEEVGDVDVDPHPQERDQPGRGVRGEPRRARGRGLAGWSGMAASVAPHLEDPDLEREEHRSERLRPGCFVLGDAQPLGRRQGEVEKRVSPLVKANNEGDVMFAQI